MTYRSSKSVKGLLKHSNLSFYQDGGRQPYWICVAKFWTMYGDIWRYCAKFLRNKCSSFDSMKVWIFCTFGMKVQLMPLKLFFWTFDPQSGMQNQHDQYRTHACVDTYHMYRASKSVKGLLRYSNLSFFQDFFLDLWGAVLDNIWIALGGLYYCAKFGWNWNGNNTLIVRKFWMFSSLAWKCL